MDEPVVITIHSVVCEDKAPLPPPNCFATHRGFSYFGNFVNLRYKLDRKYTFSSDCFARLLWVHPEPEIPVWILSDIVKDLSYNDSTKPILGACGGGEKSFPWVPLSARTIPQTGFLKLHSVDSALTPAFDNLLIQIQVAPRRFILGGGLK